MVQDIKTSGEVLVRLKMRQQSKFHEKYLEKSAREVKEKHGAKSQSGMEKDM